MSKLRFGKEWEEDILNLSQNHLFTIFKWVCIRLAIVEKDLKEARKEIEEYEKVIKTNKKG